MGRAAFVRAWWFPMALSAVTIVNGFTALQYGRGVAETQPYGLSIHEDDSLATATQAKAGVFFGIFRQHFAVQDVLGGAELLAPPHTNLPSRGLKLFARVAVRERSPLPQEQQRSLRAGLKIYSIDQRLERKLRSEAMSPPFRLGDRRLYVAPGLKPPWTRPLQVLASRDARTVYVVSQERVDRLAARPAGKRRKR